MTKPLLPLIFAISILLPTVLSAAVISDAAGRRVSVPNNPQRIIPLVPSATEALFAIGAGDQVVAVTEYANFPEEATQLPKIGSYADPGLEAILVQRPDLVIATAEGNPRALIDQLERLGISVYVITLNSVATTFESIEILGRLTNHEQESRQLQEEMHIRLARITDKLKTTEPVSLLPCVMLQPLTVAGHGTFIDDIIERAGGMNIVHRQTTGYPTWSLEALMQADPDAILLPLHPGQQQEDFFERWPQLKAVQSNRIISVEADWVYRPGPRLILGVEALAKALHPDIDFDE